MLTEFAHGFVNGLAAFHFLILQFAGGRVGGLHKHENPLIFRFANAEQRLDTVRAEVAIHGQRVRTEGFRLLAEHIRFAEVRRGVGFHRGADVVALAVRDDEHTLCARVSDGLRKGSHALPAVHLIVSNLHLDAGHDLTDLVDDGLVKLVYGVAQYLKVHPLLGDKLRRWQVGVHSIQPHANGRLHLFGLLDQLIYCHHDGVPPFPFFLFFSFIFDLPAHDGMGDHSLELPSNVGAVFPFGYNVLSLYHIALMKVCQRDIRGHAFLEPSPLYA